MDKFEQRRDRYNAFAAFDNPLVNLAFELKVNDFRPFCKASGTPPFHFFLYCVLSAIRGIDNFMYRIHDGEVIKIDDFLASYTVINQDGNLNFARFEMGGDLEQFVARSLAAKRVAEASAALINTLADQTPLAQRQNVFITCMPWLKLSAIEHPIYDYRSYDIPSLAWGKYEDAPDGKLAIPFAVQAHHGFVDGYHVHLLAEAIKAQVAALMA
jgi:chloramphenicol O-acetyltransferase type A